MAEEEEITKICTNFSDTISENIIEINQILNTLEIHFQSNPDKSIQTQLNDLKNNNRVEYNELFNGTKGLNYWCKIIDYIDCVHDFKKCNIDIETELSIDRHDINGLRTCEGNKTPGKGDDSIHIENSHKLQQKCLKNMVELLQKNGIIVPENVANEGKKYRTNVKKYWESRNLETMPLKNLFYVESGSHTQIPEEHKQSKTVYAIFDGYDSYKTKNDKPYNTEKTYDIKLYGGYVNAHFDITDENNLTLTIQLNNTTGDYIKIKLNGTAGITVNFLLTKFQLQSEYTKAKRKGGAGKEEKVGEEDGDGVGDGVKNDDFTIVEESLNIEPSKRLLIATAFKTVCDKICSTEISPTPYIDNIVTKDGYVWAGVTYKYLTGEYPIRPAIFEKNTNKDPWTIVDGIFNLNKEISDRYYKILCLYVVKNSLSNKILKQIIDVEQFSTIIGRYTYLIDYNNEIYEVCSKKINNTTTSKNIFGGLSLLNILSYQPVQNDEIEKMHNDITTVINNGNITELEISKIKLLEDILHNPGIEKTIKNEATILGNKIINSAETAAASANDFPPTPGGGLKKNKKYIKGGSNTFKDALSNGTIIAEISDDYQYMTFHLNNPKIGNLLETFKSLAEVSDEEELDAYINDENSYYKISDDHMSITSPLQMEIVWILSKIAIMHNYSDLENIIRHHGTALFTYLNPELQAKIKYNDFITMYFTAVTSNEQNITYYKLFEDFVPELLEKYKEEKVIQKEVERRAAEEESQR